MGFMHLASAAQNYLLMAHRSVVSGVFSLTPFIIVFVPLVVSIAGGRPLSRIHFGYLYLYDALLLAVSILGIFFALGNPQFRLSALRMRELGLVAIFPVWAMVYLFSSRFTEQAFREFHPFLMFLYGGLVIIFSKFVSETQVARGTRLILVALLVHFVSASVRQLAESSETFSIGVNTLADALRVIPDADGWALGLGLGAFVLFFAWKSVSQTVLVALATVIVIFQVGLLGNRAGFLATLVIFLVAIHLGRRSFLNKNGATASSRRVLVVLLAAAALGTSSALVLTDLGAKFVGPKSFSALEGQANPPADFFGTSLDEQILDELRMGLERRPENSLGTFEVLGVPSGQDPSTVGLLTARARLLCWQHTVSWLAKSPSRLVLGSGLDSGSYYESGAREALVGQAPVVQGENTWPHNFLISVTAIFGILGLAIFVMILTMALINLCSNSARGETTLNAVAILILTGVSVVSFFGVVFENPFGSVPFMWAIGRGLASREPLLGTKILWGTENRQ